jgi:hypothetical protein
MTTYYGYLETPYLMGPYLGGYVDFTLGNQVDMKLFGWKDLGNQIEQKIYDTKTTHSQTLQKIYEILKQGSQVNLFIEKESDDFKLHNQISMKIYQTEIVGNQVVQKVYDAINLGNQVLLKKEAVSFDLGNQIDQKILDDLPNGESAKLGKLLHTVWERWLTGPYLTETYLAPGFHAWQSSQISQKIYHPKILGSQVFLNVYEADNTGSQIEQKIYDTENLGSQVAQKIYELVLNGSQINQIVYESQNLPNQIELKIYDDRGLGSSVTKIKITKIGNQVALVIYNITQFRILQNFISRGTPALGGNNWTSNVPLKSGDFGTTNLNTDVIEQRCETNTMPASWILTCNTGLPQGGFIDTLAILGHNLTTSARIELQGSNDPAFGTIGFSVVLVTELINTYWISPTLPIQGFIYWRLIIDDVTNPASSLYIGSIVFGSSQIMSVSENFDNPITFGHAHFKDSIETEGYTSVSNDRALRKFLSLTFNDIRYDAGNYSMIKEYFLNNKTDLKCLIIPRPTKAGAFAVFSKLSALPQESHNAISDSEHWVSFTLDWNEAL